MPKTVSRPLRQGPDHRHGSVPRASLIPFTQLDPHPHTYSDTHTSIHTHARTSTSTSTPTSTSTLPTAAYPPTRLCVRR